MKSEVFVEQPLIAIDIDGHRSEVIIRVGKPMPCDGPYACEIEIMGLDVTPHRIFGGDPMQALHLALQMIRVLLEIRERHGGVRFHSIDESADALPFDWRRTWYQPIAGDDHADGSVG
jgi:hypothetical protein